MTVANKMLIHIGHGDDRQTYTFDYDRLMNVEAMAIERTTGRTLLEIRDSLAEVSMVSITAIVWILRRRREPGLQFEDVQFELGDIEIEFAIEEQDQEPLAPKEEDPEEQPAPN